jgi:cytochrome c oxidase subunit 2
MIGSVYVMEPQEYETWLSGGAPSGSLSDMGRKVFDQYGCVNCHRSDSTGRCPSLIGVFGSTVQLTGGGRVKADEGYIRESILQPMAKIVAGYEPIMPTFQGQVTEEQVLELVEYIRSLAPRPAAPAVAAPASSTVLPKNR